MSEWRQANTGQQKFPRVATEVAVRVSTVDPERDPDTGKLFFRSTEATTANLSRGGAYVYSWEPLAVGRRLVVAIDLPDGQELQLVAKVVWTRRELRQDGLDALQMPGYGVEFDSLSGLERVRLGRFLERAEARPPASTLLACALPTPHV